jgi:hypothetical protein
VATRLPLAPLGTRVAQASARTTSYNSVVDAKIFRCGTVGAEATFLRRDEAIGDTGVGPLHRRKK